MAEEFSVIGHRRPMVDAGPKVRGTAQFTDDILLPGMLHGRILRSPLPHARILNIDASKALALTGVKGVLTGAERRRFWGAPPKAQAWASRCSSLSASL